MSSSSSILQSESNTSAPASPNPFKNPSYPPRVHFGDKARLEERLNACEQHIATFRAKLTTLGDHPSRPAHERLFHQLLGTRDQIAECALRMPRETGALYDEDRERLVAAEAALVRILKQWDTLKA